MADPAGDKHEKFTWADYRTWDDAGRWEIVGGAAFNMAPAPLVRHQVVSRNLLLKLTTFFARRACQVLGAPVDVKLSEEDVVQPDILVVCDPRQIRPTHIEGPPSLVIEIVSPSSQVHDRVRKLNLYARSMVPEYWIVTPYPALVEVWILDRGAYRLAAGYEDRHTLRSPSFPELELSLKDIFDFPLEPDEATWIIREGHPPTARS